MKSIFVIAGLLALGFSIDIEANAQRNRSSLPRRLEDANLPGLETRIFLDSVEAWPVVRLIEFLAHRGGINNVVISQRVGELSTRIKFDDVTVGDALNIVLSVNRLAYEIDAGIIMVMTDEEFIEKYGKSFYEQREVHLHSLKYADAQRVAGMLEPLLSPDGKVIADAKTGTLIINDTPARLEDMLAVIERADVVERVVPTVKRTFRLQYGEVEAMAAQVRTKLTEGIGAIQTDARTRTLMVRDVPHAMTRIEELIAEFDRRPKAVFLESKIISIRLGEETTMGINWNALIEGVSPRYAMGISSASPIPQASGGLLESGSGAGSVSYRVLANDIELRAVIDALETVGETRIRSNPHISVLDGEEAIIKVVTDQPYAEARLEAGTTNVIGEQVVFIEVGTTLTVTPRISEDGMVTVAVRPEVSAVDGFYQARYPIPVVRKSYAETKVMVKDGSTIVIAGLIDDRSVLVENRVPLLGSIPLIGLLFRSKSEMVEARELVTFLTPRIITDDTVGVGAQRERRRELKPMRGPDPSMLPPTARAITE